MRLRAWARRLLAVAFVLFIAIQLVPVDWPENTGGEEIAAPPEIREILRTHCYDCHSSRQDRPWYSKVAPVSWLVAYDVNHGVSRLDFTDWQSETPNSAMYKIAHTGHRAREGKGKPGDWLMPPASYIRFGSGRELSGEELSKLLRWAGRHGMNLDGSDQRLRLRSSPIQTGTWQYVASVGSLERDSDSALEGDFLESVTIKRPDMAEFDPLGSARDPANTGVLIGLNRQTGTYRGQVLLDHALLFVDGNIEAKVSGRGAVVSAGDVSLEIPSGETELFVLAGGEIRIKGGGDGCRLALVSPDVVSLRDLEARGSIVAAQLKLQRSSFGYDSQMPQNELALPPSQRAVFTYCDQDGELTESDRRLEVLYEAGVFTLYDPEYDLAKQALSPSEAYQCSKELLAADSTMELRRLEQKGFDKDWLTRFQELASEHSHTTLLHYHLGDWVEP